MRSRMSDGSLDRPVRHIVRPGPNPFRQLFVEPFLVRHAVVLHSTTPLASASNAARKLRDA